MMKITFMFAALTGMLAVILDAYVNHNLIFILTEQARLTFQIGVQYQMYPSLALLLVVVLFHLKPNSYLIYSARTMLVGILLFSGSLYGLALTNANWFGPATPIGGLCLIVSWGLLAYSGLKHKHA
jgi:uncharacterized membrane protein YgdD (TMEM256/DUF423 family)